MDEPQLADSTPGILKTQQGSLAEVRKQEIVYELLTAREARRRFGFYERRLYRWVQTGQLHPVKPNGRTLYPAWELEQLAEGGGGTAITSYAPVAA